MAMMYHTLISGEDGEGVQDMADLVKMMFIDRKRKVCLVLITVSSISINP